MWKKWTLKTQIACENIRFSSSLFAAGESSQAKTKSVIVVIGKKFEM